MYVFMGPLKTFLFVLQTQEYMFLSCGLIQWSVLKAHANCLWPHTTYLFVLQIHTVCLFIFQANITFCLYIESFNTCVFI